MRRRIRKHVNPLKSELLSIPVERVPAPGSGFLEVELGAAEGEFLVARAREDRSGTYVGVEIRSGMVRRANQLAAREGMANVSCVFANISVDLPKLFAPGSVRRFDLNFPDPWWKSRQHKRRVISRRFLDHLHAALEHDGELFVQTDIFELALEAMSLLEADAPRRFQNRVAAWSFLRESPFEARSRQQSVCEARGARVWRLLYQKLS